MSEKDYEQCVRQYCPTPEARQVYRDFPERYEFAHGDNPVAAAVEVAEAAVYEEDSPALAASLRTWKIIRQA
jgi:hypothetical protein